MGEINTNLNDIDQTLRGLGISLKKLDGTFKYIGDLLNEISDKWRNLYEEQ